MNELKPGGHAVAETNPDGIAEADVVIGLFASGNAANMELAVAKASGGARRYYPGLRTVLACSDAASSDGTREAFLAAPSETPKIYMTTSPREGSKKFCFFNVVELASRLKAKAVVTFEARITTTKKTWFPRLLDPILKNGACFTSPIYSRHPFDLPITHLLSYPLFRALFGRRIRNPHLGDAAFSGSLNAVYMNSAWPLEPDFSSVELATAALAVSHGPVFQSFMADPRVGSSRRHIDLGVSEEFCATLRSFYELMILYPKLWKKSRNSRPTPITGTDLKGDVLPPRELLGDQKSYLALIADAARSTRDVWEKEFPAHLPLWQALRDPSPAGVKVTAAQWADLVYSGAAAYRSAGGGQAGGKIVAALMPVFIVRLLEYKRVSATATASQTSAHTENEAVVFEKAKPGLIARWKD
ncbi:MAG: hypothetical protein LBW85_00235 [Deltaproteobacteria bacterium]|jgi:hypothetical protein|nr:hypothetical protein [Deltaproteobacteria bacterium]